jgi:hypothetical protein
MIKTQLHKYKINNCPSSTLETDIQLIPVKQRNGEEFAVGVSLAQGCMAENFIDSEKYNRDSFLK